MGVVKVWPTVFRQRDQLEILAFEHPLAGLQLVKGGVESGETAEAAALRELYEEAGIKGHVACSLGVLTSEVTGAVWAFYACQVARPLPDNWTHFTDDDGGHAFRFFWHPLGATLSDQWHPIFKEALTFIQATLASERLNEMPR